jgi:transcriptional regulator
LSESGEWVDKSDGKKSRIDTKYYDAMKSPLTVEVKAGEKNNFEFEVDPRT